MLVSLNLHIMRNRVNAPIGVFVGLLHTYHIITPVRTWVEKIRAILCWQELKNLLIIDYIEEKKIIISLRYIGSAGRYTFYQFIILFLFHFFFSFHRYPVLEHDLNKVLYNIYILVRITTNHYKHNMRTIVFKISKVQ